MPERDDAARPEGMNRPRAAPKSGARRSDAPRSSSPRAGGAAAGREDKASRARRSAGAPPRLTDEQRAEIAARYDPRREQRRQEARVALPEDVEPRMLDPEVRTELRSLSKDTADLVARHLVMAGRLVDEDPAAALTHARAARALAGRVGAVREAAGLTAYLAGEWAEALSELRTARRITGRSDHLPVLADCERGLGRPERALAVGADAAVATLDQAIRVELVIVLAGARRDLAQPDAAVVLLQDPARRTTAKRPWAPRLWYAYADALLAAGRTEDAREWFSRAADVDVEGETDASERLLELDGVVLDEPADDPDGDVGDGPGAQP
jgi:tetratricopeptide (TPR) repeat protein